MPSVQTALRRRRDLLPHASERLFLRDTSAGVLAVEDGSDRTGVRAKTGFSARVAIGKEWWVASQFGIGVAANGFLGINGDELETDTARSTCNWTTLGAGASFTGSSN